MLANLFLHYVFDVWLDRGFSGVPFERYADDIICHCRSEREALKLRQVLEQRFAECGLVLHPEKTKVVYCKDTNRKGDHAIIQFDFLGTLRATSPFWSPAWAVTAAAVAFVLGYKLGSPIHGARQRICDDMSKLWFMLATWRQPSHGRCYIR
jgi:hypothetical protein